MRKLDKSVKLCFTGALLCFIIMIPMGISNRNETKLIDQTGVEAIGTVINATGISRRSIPSVQFKFDYQGNVVVTVDQTVGSEVYNKVAIGARYKVKFLPDNPKKARIYLDQPVFYDAVE